LKNLGRQERRRSFHDSAGAKPPASAVFRGGSGCSRREVIPSSCSLPPFFSTQDVIGHSHRRRARREFPGPRGSALLIVGAAVYPRLDGPEEAHALPPRCRPLGIWPPRGAAIPGRTSR
jgi:hypothetical protein